MQNCQRGVVGLQRFSTGSISEGRTDPHALTCRSSASVSLVNAHGFGKKKNHNSIRGLRLRDIDVRRRPAAPSLVLCMM